MGKITDLTSDILLKIIIRLPTESVLECKLVCKPWNNLFCYDRTFYKRHQAYLADHPVPGEFNFLGITPDIGGQKFYNLKYNENDFTLGDSRFNIKPPFDFYGFIGCSNGLICLNGCRNCLSSDYDAVYICNPIRNECVILPKFDRNVGELDTVYGGFGYVNSRNEYKVVRIIANRGWICPDSCVEVYTLGSRTGWRRVVQHQSPQVGNFVSPHGVVANEALHWISKGDGKIISFHLGDERFYEIPQLPCLQPEDYGSGHRYLKLAVLGGDLWCSIFRVHRANPPTVCWSLKRGTTWSEECSLDKVEPLAWMKSGKLLCHSSKQLLSYNVNSSRYIPLMLFRRLSVGKMFVSHVNTFVSLKELGEEDTKQMR